MPHGNASALGVHPARQEEADDRGDAEERGRGRPHRARAGLVRERPGDDHAESEERVSEAHDDRERPSAQPVGRAALDEDGVGDDGDAVPRARGDHDDRGHPDVRRRGGRPESERHEPDRDPVGESHPSLLDPARAEEAADHEPDRTGGDEEPVAEVSGVEHVLREHDLRHVHAGRGEDGDAPRDDDGQQRFRAEGEGEALGEVLPVAPARRALRLLEALADADDQERRDEEADRVHQVGGIRARRRDERAAHERADRPREVVRGLEEAVRLREVFVRDEVGEPRVDGRAEEARRHPRDEGERDDLQRARREREDEEDRRPGEVGDDEDPSARGDVEQPPGKEADDHARQELDHEQGADPRRVLGAIEDVDDERDEREPCPDAGSERRKEEKAESSSLPHEPEAGPPAAPCHGPNRNSAAGDR